MVTFNASHSKKKITPKERVSERTRNETTETVEEEEKKIAERNRTKEKSY